MISSTLIPSVTSRDRWRRYFRFEVLRALGYCKKVLGLYNRICTDSSSPLIRKMVIGVIGRDTIGHWRDIQTLYRRFFGITCKKCEDAVKRIAMGVPLENVIDSIQIQTVNRWRLVEDVKAMTTILNSIVSKAINKHDAEPEDIETMVKHLSSNSLEVFRLIKGFYSTNISLLPLYNECTFFLYITRSINKGLIDKFFPGLDIAMLSSYGIEFKVLRVCRDDEFAILVPSSNSVSQYVITYISTLYRVLRQSLRLGLATFFRILDEEHVFVTTMAKEAKKLEREMSPQTSSTVINTVCKNSLILKTRSNYAYLTTNILFYKDKDEVAVGSGNLRCKDLFDGLSPYLVTGLAHFSDINDKGGDIVKARLHLYHYST